MKAKEKSIPTFFTGGGQMGELIRTFDWSKTSVGSPDTWPQSLRIAVRIMLDTPFGMYIAWGNEYIQLYNDGYRPILGATKHPQALGISTRKTFAEIWSTIGPMFEGVMQGTPVGFPDFTLLLDRNGFLEECVFDFSYSPIRLEDGEVGGVLVTVIETTEKVKAAKALEEREQELQFAIEAAELGTWDLNPATNKFRGNNRLKEWFGLKPDDEIELPLALAVIADKDRDKVTAAIQTALKLSSGGYYDIIYTIIHPQTKKEKIVRAKGRASFNDEGIAYQFNGTLQDVTKEIAGRQLLTESEQRFRTLTETIPHMVWTATPDGKKNFFNQYFLDYTGLSFEELKGDGWQATIFPVDLKKELELWHHSLFTGEDFKIEKRLRCHDGTYRWHLSHSMAQKDTEGKIIGWIGTNTDIAEQKSFAEELETKVKERTEQLQLQNQTFELAESIAKFGSYRWNMTTGLLEYSANLFRLLDCEPQEFAPSFEKFLSFIHPDDLQQVISNGEQTMQTGELIETPYRIISKTGKIKYFRSSGNFSGEGVNRLLIGTVQDISKDVTASKQLQAKNLELENANAELASFSYVASHDLQEPLRKIQAFSRRIIETENFSDTTQNYFNRIISAGERMQNLIVSLLNFSRTNSAELIFVPCDLTTIVEESKSELHLSILEKQAIIEHENLPTVNGVYIQLSQLFTNLIDNAIKYSRPEIKPHIKITASLIHGNEIEHPSANKQQEYHVLKIADNGIGFENEYATKIFGFFQRLHGKKEYSGTGIGLAIVKKIVTNHNGFIVAEGQPNIGSTFTVYIPTA